MTFQLDGICFVLRGKTMRTNITKTLWVSSLAVILTVFSVGCNFDNEDGDSTALERANGQTEYYVSPTGSNSNAGTLAAPFLTIQKAADTVAAGDTVYVRAGTYNEMVVMKTSGTASAPIIFRNYGTEVPVINGSGKPVGEDDSVNALILITDKNYIKIIGFSVTNYVSSNNLVPAGIRVRGTSKGIEIRNTKVYGIKTTYSGSNEDRNAHAIAVHGTNDSTSLDGLIIDGCEVYSNLLGQSEAVVLNGNVTNFTVTNNIVHDNDNIGIDFIGYEQTAATAVDQARDGICSDNTVYNITSANNPTYGGGVSADGIYVDGGKNIVIERNKIWNCDIGIEAASEHYSRVTSNVIIRNNFIANCPGYTGITIGGYAKAKSGTDPLKGTGMGSVTDIKVLNNTFYNNQTNITIQFQANVSSNVIRNNITYLGTSIESNESTSNIVISNNITADPKFVNASTRDFHLQSTSPAINAGVSDSNMGSTDMDKNARVYGSAVDVGAYEYGSGSAVSYTITASAGANGSISPSGAVSVSQGANQTFTITPNSGYATSSIIVDGVSQTIAPSYTFTNVQAAHSISATFVQAVTYTITASANANGSISPSGSVVVTQGANQTFTITPNSGYVTSSILVDGVSQTIASTYTFTNVQAAHSIVVSFSASPDTNIAPSGTGYVWYGNSSATSNSNRSAKTGINNLNLTTAVAAKSSNDSSNRYEAGGVVFSAAKTISSVSFINGSMSGNNGYFEANLVLQTSTNGTTWTTVSGWTLDKTYTYTSAVAGQTYTFSGAALTGIKGVRVCGQVNVSGKAVSKIWRVNEVLVMGH